MVAIIKTDRKNLLEDENLMNEKTTTIMVATTMVAIIKTNRKNLLEDENLMNEKTKQNKTKKKI